MASGAADQLGTYKALLDAQAAQIRAQTAQIEAQTLQIQVQAKRIAALEGSLGYSRDTAPKRPAESIPSETTGSSRVTKQKLGNAIVPVSSTIGVTSNSPVVANEEGIAPADIHGNKKMECKRKADKIGSIARPSSSKKSRLIVEVVIDAPSRAKRRSDRHRPSSRSLVLPRRSPTGLSCVERGGVTHNPRGNSAVSSSSVAAITTITQTQGTDAAEDTENNRIDSDLTDYDYDNDDRLLQVGSDVVQQVSSNREDHKKFELPIRLLSTPVPLNCETKSDIKIKIGPDLLDEDSIRARLQVIGHEPYPVSLDYAIRSRTVSRAFMSKHYGGNAISLCPSIDDKKYRHQYRNFMYPGLDMNPHAPRQPGQPGLLCRATREVSWKPENQKVLVRIGPGVCLYMGEYAMSPASSLMASEFHKLSPLVKSTWAKRILTRKKDKAIRVRVILRRQHPDREPTQAEVTQAVKSENAFNDLTIDEIKHAFENGLETIYIWCMKCVGYGEGFQRELASRLAAEPVPADKGQAGRSGPAQSKSRNSHSRGSGIGLDASGSGSSSHPKNKSKGKHGLRETSGHDETSGQEGDDGYASG
ncbi:hypothetical protein AcV5_006880 [Taiwanofungus camphoratus]|nr:hypothetical protein AcV5_006880 [Antrodia cinnamomea]